MTTLHGALLSPRYSQMERTVMLSAAQALPDRVLGPRKLCFPGGQDSLTHIIIAGSLSLVDLCPPPSLLGMPLPSTLSQCVSETGRPAAP